MLHQLPIFTPTWLHFGFKNEAISLQNSITFLDWAKTAYGQVGCTKSSPTTHTVANSLLHQQFLLSPSAPPSQPAIMQDISKFGLGHDLWAAQVGDEEHRVLMSCMLVYSAGEGTSGTMSFSRAWNIMPPCGTVHRIIMNRLKALGNASSLQHIHFDTISLDITEIDEVKEHIR